MSRVWKLLLWLLLVISPTVVYGAGSASSPKDSPPDDKVVVMDKMIVGAARFHWRYAKSEHFEILSSYPDDDFAARVVQSAELCINTFEKNLPIFRSNHELPEKLIFIGDNGIGRFITAIGKTNDWWFHSARNTEQIIMIDRISRPKKESRFSNAAAVGTNLAHSYLEVCLDGKKATGFPAGDLLWSFRSTLFVNRNTITLELFRPGIEIGWIKELSKDDYENKLPKYGYRWADALLNKLPLIKLCDIVEDTGSGIIWPDPGCSVEDAQRFISFMRRTMGFAYYCAFGPNPETRGAFENLMKYRGKGLPITEEVFKRYFGKSYEEFSDEMGDFYRKSSKDTKYRGSDNAWGDPEMVIAYFDLQKVPKIAWADATRSQSARIISDWFLLNKQPDIARKTLDLAKADAPYVRNDPEFCAAWGLSEMQYGDKATALSLLEKAAGSKIGRPEVYRSLSRLYLENILVTKGKNYKLDSTEVIKVIAPLYDALKISQSNPKTCFQVLQLIRRTNESFPKEFWDTMVTNCSQQFPDNFDLLYQLVPILRKNGLTDEAARLLDATEKCPLTEREQQRLEQLKAMVYR